MEKMLVEKHVSLRTQALKPWQKHERLSHAEAFMEQERIEQASLCMAKLTAVTISYERKMKLGGGANFDCDAEKPTRWERNQRLFRKKSTTARDHRKRRSRTQSN